VIVHREGETPEQAVAEAAARAAEEVKERVEEGTKAEELAQPETPSE
jgi:hypothetical protein